MLAPRASKTKTVQGPSPATPFPSALFLHHTLSPNVSPTFDGNQSPVLQIVYGAQRPKSRACRALALRAECPITSCL